MEEVRKAYDTWAAQYDTQANKTRDLEAIALRELMATVNYDSCLELGCGTGKNTAWLASRCKHHVAVDLSPAMLAEARRKIRLEHVRFVAADLNKSWEFVDREFDLVAFSLVLEHIEVIGPVIEKAAAAITVGGHLYVGELHPFKQYQGSKARFETDRGSTVVDCFTHHVSDFLNAARKVGLQLCALRELADAGTQIPRILALLFKKI